MPLNLDSCIAGVFTPGNIGASSGLPPVVRVVPSLDDDAPAVAEAAAAADTLDYFMGQLLHEAASAADSYGATGGAYEALVAESAAAADAPSVHEPGDILTGVTETAAADSAQDATVPSVISASITEAASASDTQDYEALGPPAILTGLIGWWDASVTSSLTLAGSSVEVIADQSGVGNNLTWLSFKPTYSATGFNSRPAVLTTPNQAMQKTSFPMGTGNTLTIFYVGTLGTTVVNYARFMSYRGNAGFSDYNHVGSWDMNKGTSSTQVMFDRNSVSVTGTTTANPAPHRLIVTVSSAGAITMYIDGVSVATGTSSGNWTSLGTFSIAKNSGGVSDFIAAPFAEWGVATGFSNSTTVAALDTYLKNKWGL